MPLVRDGGPFRCLTAGAGCGPLKGLSAAPDQAGLSEPTRVAAELRLPARSGQIRLTMARLILLIGFATEEDRVHRHGAVRAVDGRAGDRREELREVGDRVLVGAAELNQVGFLELAELGRLTAQGTLGAGDLGSLAGRICASPASKAATMASTLGNGCPSGSLRWCSCPPTLSRVCWRASSARICWASGSERAKRSSRVTISVSPTRHAARAPCSAGRSRVVSSQIPMDVGALGSTPSSASACCCACSSFPQSWDRDEPSSPADTSWLDRLPIRQRVDRPQTAEPARAGASVPTCA